LAILKSFISYKYLAKVAYTVTLIFITVIAVLPKFVFAMAHDCQYMPSVENYLGVRYRAVLVEDELSETGWVLLFGGNGFTKAGEYEGHFVNLMIKAGWADIWCNGDCAPGFPIPRRTYKVFTICMGDRRLRRRYWYSKQ